MVFGGEGFNVKASGLPKGGGQCPAVVSAASPAAGLPDERRSSARRSSERGARRGGATWGKRVAIPTWSVR